MEYSTIILTAAKIAKVPGSVLLAICMNESNLQNIRVPQDGRSASVGICQVKESTAHMLGYKYSENDLMNPEINAQVAASYLRYQINRYEGNLMKATAAYNSGKYNPSNIVVGCPRNLTYIKRVQSKMDWNNRGLLACRSLAQN